MSLVCTAAPTTEPLRLEEVKKHLAVEHPEDDAKIANLMTAARQWVEEYTWRQLITATFVMRLHRPPCGVIYVPRPKLLGVTSIQYVDWNGVLQTWDSAERQVDIYSEPGIVAPAYGYSWPSCRDQLNAFIMTFTCGYGPDRDDVPMPIRTAMLQIVAHLYENPEPTITGTIATDLQLMFSDLLAPYKFRDERVTSFV
ncbi:MAG: head-tail connector protein [Thermoanaerobaculia bacterium]